jgi:hypothetical protein
MKTPTRLYKANADGTVVVGLFDAAEALPDGWHDAPGKARNEPQATPKRGPGRPRKQDNGE